MDHWGLFHNPMEDSQQKPTSLMNSFLHLPGARGTAPGILLSRRQPRFVGYVAGGRSGTGGTGRALRWDFWGKPKSFRKDQKNMIFDEKPAFLMGTLW